MRIDHGGRHILVAEQFLDRADVGAVHQQMGSKGMPQGVRRHPFYYASLSGSLLHRPLQIALVQMMTPLNLIQRINSNIPG